MLFISIAIAVSGGLVTGMILRLPIFGKVARDHLFDDQLSWELPESEPDRKTSTCTEPMFTHHQKDKNLDESHM